MALNAYADCNNAVCFAEHWYTGCQYVESFGTEKHVLKLHKSITEESQSKESFLAWINTSLNDNWWENTDKNLGPYSQHLIFFVTYEWS